jgi:hypothetical protein
LQRIERGARDQRDQLVRIKRDPRHQHFQFVGGQWFGRLRGRCARIGGSRLLLGDRGHIGTAAGDQEHGDRHGAGRNNSTFPHCAHPYFNCW